MTDAELRTTCTRIDYDEPGRAVVVEWADGAVLPIPFAQLRRGCPCALCQGEMGRPGRFEVDPELRTGEDELADLQPVGHYAIGLQWADGHNTGIYTFEHLRALGEQAAARR
jgi:DUF971 family protein